MLRRPIPLVTILLLSACGDPAPRAADAGVDASAPAKTAETTAVAFDAGTDAGPTTDAGTDAGAITDAGAPPDTRPRIGSIAPTTWIYASRKRQGRIGYLRPGGSAVLRDPAPWEPKRKGPWGECKSGRWWAIEPSGYICDDETTTRDLEGPLFRALVAAGPREGAYPFDYAFSTRAPMYGKLPVEKEQKKGEKRLRPVAELSKIKRSTAGHEDLAEMKAVDPTGAVPPFLADHAPAPLPPGKKPALVKKHIPYGSMLSFSQAFAAEGRTFLLSPDLSLVPSDRMRPFRRTTFHGVAIDATTPLPIGWFRKQPRSKFRRGEGGALTDTGDRWAPRTFVGLTGKTVEHEGVTYVETRESGLYARASDVSVVSEPEELPQKIEPDERWIDVSLSKGTLTLFVGKKATFSTLMSPGAGGVTPKITMTIPELVSAALTPLGQYRIAVKHKSAQMTSEDKPDPESFWIADVPWVQYFRPPFAIHAAYWHEDFGQPKSGGCVNLSPEDARTVFEFTGPHVPETWWGANARKDDPGTWLVIRR
ncbi:MAG: L,D-transpeptidase [Minicystis sp.]